MLSRCFFTLSNNVQRMLTLCSKFHASGKLLEDFKSSCSLDIFYPQSSLRFDQPNEVHIKKSEFTGYIPINELDITYSRSSGPGGQHINKANTKVEVRFKIEDAKWIPEDVKSSLLKLHENNITKDGYFIVRSDKTRMQTLNLADCMDKLRCYIREAAKPPPVDLPETQALLRQRQERAAAIRLRDKRHKSMVRNMKRRSLYIEC